MSDLMRREFLKQLLLQAGAMGTSPAWLGAAEAEQDAAGLLDDVRSKTLRFIDAMRVAEEPYGQYLYAGGVSRPTLYSSTYAAMTRHLYRDLGELTKSEREQWIGYLQSHQDDDGLFRDPVIFGEGWYADDPLWCGRPHLSCHVVTALTCLDAVAEKPLRWLDPFLPEDDLVRWLESRDWGERVAWSGNEVLNVGTLLQYARDFQNNDRCGAALKTIRAWMAESCDPATGLWGVGPLDLDRPTDLSHAVQAAYHFWLLWFYDREPIPYAKQAVVQVLRTQNSQGSFGCGVHNGQNPNDGSACEDIDSIDPLARLMATSENHRDQIRASLTRAEPWVLSNQTELGSFSFLRGQAFSYGHPKLSATIEEGGMFPTWFRTLTLAYLGKALPNSICGQFDWQFCNCPGIQFWPTS